MSESITNQQHTSTKMSYKCRSKICPGLTDVATRASETPTDVVTLNETKMDNRTQNKKVEAKRIAWLVQSFKEKIENNDIKFTTLMASVRVPAAVIEAVIPAGSRKQHYDMVIVLKDGRSITIEHKGVTNNSHDTEHPWSNTPELLNIPYNGSTLTRKYCDTWYQHYIPKIAAHFDNLPEIPLFNDWMKCDASPGSPKTLYGIELKRQVADLTNKSYINSLYYKSLTQFWNEVLYDSTLTSSIEAEILREMNAALDCKGVWLNAVYDTKKSLDPTSITVSIPPRVVELKIVRQTWGSGKKRFDEDASKKCTVVINYKLTSNPDKLFEGRLDLNFGNRNGIANVRLLVRGVNI